MKVTLPEQAFFSRFVHGLEVIAVSVFGAADVVGRGVGRGVGKFRFLAPSAHGFHFGDLGMDQLAEKLTDIIDREAGMICKLFKTESKIRMTNCNRRSKSQF